MFTLQNITGMSPSRPTTNYSRPDTSTRCSMTRSSTAQKKRTLDSLDGSPETTYSKYPVLAQSRSTPNIRVNKPENIAKKKKLLQMQPNTLDVIPKMCTSHDIEEKCNQAIMHNKQNMEHNSDVLLTEHGIVRRSQMESL